MSLENPSQINKAEFLDGEEEPICRDCALRLVDGNPEEIPVCYRMIPLGSRDLEDDCAECRAFAGGWHPALEEARTKSMTEEVERLRTFFDRVAIRQTEYQHDDFGKIVYAEMALAGRSPELAKLREFVGTIARMFYDGEERDCTRCHGTGGLQAGGPCNLCDGSGKEEFDMTSDDAVETVNILIRQARELVGGPTPARTFSTSKFLQEHGDDCVELVDDEEPA